MSSESQIDNKRVAKNTLLLYMRMFLLMGIGLFTSRVTLQTLGVEDFGIYNVVWGLCHDVQHLDKFVNLCYQPIHYC